MGNLTFEYLYTVGGYITFIIRVRSREFSGISSFCIAENLLKETILSLSKMYEDLKGTYEINDYDSNDFILFEFLNLGHMKISGQVGGSYNEQYLKYEFITDQTVLNNIILSFKSMIA